MKKLLTLLSVFIFTLMLLTSTGCTENQKAKGWGGTAKYEVPKGKKVVTVTWKDSDLWILTRKMTPTDKPEVYHFFEESSYGLMNGTYIITEHR